MHGILSSMSGDRILLEISRITGELYDSPFDFIIPRMRKTLSLLQSRTCNMEQCLVMYNDNCGGCVGSVEWTVRILFLA